MHTFTPPRKPKRGARHICGNCKRPFLRGYGGQAGGTYWGATRQYLCNPCIERWKRAHAPDPPTPD